MGQLRRVEHRDVSLESIRPNTWNYRGMDARMLEKEKASFQRFGYIMPILVRRHPDGEGFEILDGEHRWRTAGTLEMGAIDIIELVDDDTGAPISDAVAKEITIVINETHGDPRYEDLSKLIGELNQTVGMGELNEVMPFPSAELHAMIGLFNRPTSGADSSATPDDEQGAEARKGIAPAVHPDDNKGDDWITTSIRLPPGAHEVFLEAVKLATEGQKMPKDVRLGVGLEAIAQAFIVGHKAGKGGRRRKVDAPAS